jgi:hypothetical protein
MIVAHRLVISVLVQVLGVCNNQPGGGLPALHRRLPTQVGIARQHKQWLVFAGTAKTG